MYKRQLESTFNVVVSTVKSPVTFNAGTADVSNNLAGNFVFAILVFISYVIRVVLKSCVNPLQLLQLNQGHKLGQSVHSHLLQL